MVSISFHLTHLTHSHDEYLTKLGKFAQSNQPTQVYFIDSQDELEKLVLDSSKEISAATILSDDILQVFFSIFKNENLKISKENFFFFLKVTAKTCLDRLHPSLNTCFIYNGLSVKYMIKIDFEYI